MKFKTQIIAGLLMACAEGSASAVELDCLQNGGGDEFWINTDTGKLTYGGKIQNVQITADNAHYGLVGMSIKTYSGSIVEAFSGSINRSTGHVHINGYAMNFDGECKPVAAPKM